MAESNATATESTPMGTLGQLWSDGLERLLVPEGFLVQIPDQAYLAEMPLHQAPNSKIAVWVHQMAPGAPIVCYQCCQLPTPCMLQALHLSFLGLCSDDFSRQFLVFELTRSLGPPIARIRTVKSISSLFQVHSSVCGLQLPALLVTR